MKEKDTDGSVARLLSPNKQTAHEITSQKYKEGEGEDALQTEY